MPKTTAEGISIIIVMIPMLAAVTSLVGFVVSNALSRFRWWNSIMVWWWGDDWKPVAENIDDRGFCEMLIFLGISLVIIPCLTVLGYCLWTDQPPAEYIITSWQQIRFI